ncbi:hypothetical protein [Bartonella sp. AA126HLJHH]|uniref:hypothetical protein n=1 Tax=Bartonella sp. AA126HLJHH TaxID=3243426 RepID=UPI0035CF5250
MVIRLVNILLFFSDVRGENSVLLFSPFDLIVKSRGAMGLASLLESFFAALFLPMVAKLLGLPMGLALTQAF